MKQDRTILLVVHTGRPEGVQAARTVAETLSAAGVTVRVLKAEADDIRCADAKAMPTAPQAAEGAEMVVVIGGDGTLLRAAEIARPARTPLLGVNLGHVGFLAETEPEVLSSAVDDILARRYLVESRMTIDLTVRQNSHVSAVNWALNDATVEKAARGRMIDLVTEVDGRPLSRWGCDGVVFATPTGSTAYAFSAGGPVIWPDVEALLLVPISAHALFVRSTVVSPDSVLAAELIGASELPGEASGAVLWCDGRRMIELAPGARVEARRGALPVLLARLRPDQAGPGEEMGASFTDRLVAKFGLPVAGWRGLAEARQGGAARTRDEEAAGGA